jgi:hypothetical protein
MVEYSNQALRPDMSSFIHNMPHNTTKASSSSSMEAPAVLEKVEQVIQKDIVEQPHIIEQHQKDIIEVHEKPVQKTILHPHQEIQVSERVIENDTEGKDMADRERHRVLNEMEIQDSKRPVVIQHVEDVTVHGQQPRTDIVQQVRRDIVQKPVVTEIHQQPITEIHERDVFKTVHEAPVVTVIREAPTEEIVSVSGTPLQQHSSTFVQQQQPMTTTGFTQTQPTAFGYTQSTMPQQQQFIQQPITNTGFTQTHPMQQTQPMMYGQTQTPVTPANRAGFGGKMKIAALKIKRKLLLPRQHTTAYQSKPYVHQTTAQQPYTTTYSNEPSMAMRSPIQSQQQDHVTSHTTTTRTELYDPVTQQQQHQF